MHSQSIQSVNEAYLDARQSAYNSIQKGIKTAKYPYKQKQNFPTKWKKDGFTIYPDGKIELSLGIKDRKRQPKINLHASNLPEGQVKEIELCYDNGLHLSVSFENGEEAKEYTKKNEAAVDLGEIHSISAFTSSGEAVIITGRKVRAINQLRNKKIAEVNRLLSRCTKGSKRWKRLMKVKRYILSKSAKQLEDALHKTTKQFVDWCIKQRVSDVSVGNPEGVQRNTRKKKRTNKKTSQKLSNWSFGKIKSYLEYKLEAEGIKMYEVDESYTSQTCPAARREKRSLLGITNVLVAMLNIEIYMELGIYSKALYGDIRHIDVSTILKYLRIV